MAFEGLCGWLQHSPCFDVALRAFERPELRSIVAILLVEVRPEIGDCSDISLRLDPSIEAFYRRGSLLLPPLFSKAVFLSSVQSFHRFGGVAELHGDECLVDASSGRCVERSQHGLGIWLAVQRLVEEEMVVGFFDVGESLVATVTVERDFFELLFWLWFFELLSPPEELLQPALLALWFFLWKGGW